jgi:hypothetical protein
MPTRDELIRHYACLSDDRLMALAVNAAGELTAEAVDVLKAELHARRLDDRLPDVIAIQTRPVAPDELEALVQCARALPCPSCGSTASMLNAATVGTVRSFVVMTSYEKSIVVGCPSCIRAAADKADTLTAAFGWWALPFGPVHTIRAILLNAKAASVARQQQPTPEFMQFVEANRGAVLLQLQAHNGREGRGGPTSGCS